MNDANFTSNPTLIAVIREDECIGCVKCIRACPTDAILGASKLMHTVITDACTGCALCVAPCPMDCIDLVTVAPPNESQRIVNEQRWEMRRQQHTKRLAQTAKKTTGLSLQTLSTRKTAIAEAVLRAKAKKL